MSVNFRKNNKEKNWNWIIRKFSHTIQNNNNDSQVKIRNYIKVERNEAFSYRSEAFKQQKIGQKAITFPTNQQLATTVSLCMYLWIDRSKRREQNQNLKLTHQTKSGVTLEKLLLLYLEVERVIMTDRHKLKTPTL